VKGRERRHRILHVDLDPFFVSVERSNDPSLRGRPVVVGGDAASSGIVAAVSDEARGLGVLPGMSLVRARRLCPEAAYRPGDLEAYARVSDEVTALLLASSRRVERPSVDEAYLDLTPEHPWSASPVAAAEHIKDELQRRLGLDAAFGLASSRLAARVASRGARPRGLLVVLPGYEAAFLDRQPVSVLPDLPPHLETSLARAGFATLGDVRRAEEAALAAAVGPAAAALRAAARGEPERPIAVAAPPSAVQVEAPIRARGSDAVALRAILEGLAERAWGRIRPYRLAVGSVSVEVGRGEATQRAAESFEPALAAEDEVRVSVHRLAEPLLEPAATVRSLQVRLGRLGRPGPVSPQAPLFPGLTHEAQRRTRLL
jgi:DNA polymerase-4